MKSYFRILFVPWKFCSLLIAYGALLLAGEYAGDPTWDIWSSTIMSIMTFLSAPWVVAQFFFAFRDRKFNQKMLMAVLLWISSAILSYEIYVFFKTGFAAEASVDNAVISSAFFFLAGIFWSISLEGKSVSLEFLNPKWPNIKGTFSLKGILYVGLPVMIVYMLILWRLTSV